MHSPTYACGVSETATTGRLDGRTVLLLFVTVVALTIVDIALDKGDPNIAKSKAFIDTVDAIWGLVRDEAIKAQEARVSP